MKWLALTLVTLSLLCGVLFWPITTAWSQETAPIVIAHRGASGALPEHTLEAYRLAIQQGADYIEPDLVLTRDGHLVARHDVYLSSSTDIATKPEFASRRRVIDGRDDWFVFDFTLAEIKSLRAKQPFAGRSPAYDGLYDIPSFGDIISLAAAWDGPVRVYPEMKQPAMHRNHGHLDPAGAMKSAFADLEARQISYIFQCFDPNFLKELRGSSKAPMVLLLYNAAGQGEAPAPNLNYRPYRPYIDGVGADKSLLVDERGRALDLLTQALADDLFVHAWTIRDDRLPPAYGSVDQEVAALFEHGVSGIFTDFPATSVAARDRFQAGNLIRPPNP